MRRCNWERVVSVPWCHRLHRPIGGVAQAKHIDGGRCATAGQPAPRLWGCYRDVRARASATTLPASVLTLAQYAAQASISRRRLSNRSPRLYAASTADGIAREVASRGRLAILGPVLGRTMIDVMVRPTDAGCELRYLPQATEEDHGAHPFKGTGWKRCRVFGSAHLRGRAG